MATTLRELKTQLLQDGGDLILDDADAEQVKLMLPSLEDINQDDMRTLVEMRTQARSVSLAFDRFFFTAFKSHLLADGKLSQAEQFQLLRMLYGGNGVDPAKKQFLTDLRQEPAGQTPEFEALYQQMLRD